MSQLTIPVSTLEGKTYEEDIKMFEFMPDSQAFESEDGGDSDADDALPLTISMSSREGASLDISAPGPSRKRKSTCLSSLPQLSSGGETSTGEEDIPDDTPLFRNRIVPEDEEEEEIGDEEEEIEGEDLWFDWRNDIGGSKIRTTGPTKVTVDILEIFCMFLTPSFVSHIVGQSVLYAKQLGQTFTMTSDDFFTFLGILIIMGINQLPSQRLYWSSNPIFRHSLISKMMSMRRFLSILRMLHLNDNSVMPPREDPQFDKLFKIRPMLTHFSTVFKLSFSPSSFLSIDESMIGFKGRSSLKQYMPMKPIKRGFKVWVICCAETGYIVDFDFYSGKTGGDQQGSLGERDVGALDDLAESIKVQRRNRLGKKEDTACPAPTSSYNKYMGGVDLFDQLMSYYSIQWKSRRWWMKVFFYFMDAAIVNSYTIYKINSKTLGKKPLSHLMFRCKLAELFLGKRTEKTQSPVIITKTKFQGGEQFIVPASEGHVPMRVKKWRCALCSSRAKPVRSNMACKMCNVGLCRYKCFEEFHKKIITK